MVALFVAAPAFAGTVTLSVVDKGGGWASIQYSADADVSGFGLKVTADSGAVFTGDINDYNVGECTATVQGYGIFPGTIVINETTGVVESNGTPVAPNDDPGAGGSGPNTNTLILEMGALYVEGNEPDTNGTLISVKVDKDCNVCVEGEPIRGNVVLTDANEAILVPDCTFVNGPVTDCFYEGMVDKCGRTITATMVTKWEELGKPDCWCYDCHCRGDVDGNGRIRTSDSEAWRDAWDVAYDACCDTNYDGRIRTSDSDGTGIGDGWKNGWDNGCP